MWSAAAALTLSLVTASWLAGGLTTLAGERHAAALTMGVAVVLDRLLERRNQRRRVLDRR